MNGGFTVDIEVLHQAAQALRGSAADLEGTLGAIIGSSCDIPDQAFTETDLFDISLSPSAKEAYAQARGNAEVFLRTMITRLINLAGGLDTVAQHYQSADAANTAAARSIQS